MARSKVNTKFVIILAGSAIVAAGGLVGLYYTLVHRSAEQLAAKGDQRLAEGDPRAAIDLYSKAANKEQTNPVWLRKWRDAMVAWTPPDQVRFRNQFEQYQIAMRALAFATNPDAKELLADQVAFLEFMSRMAGPSAPAWQRVEQEASSLIATYDQNASSEWKGLVRYRAIARARQLEGQATPEAATIEAIITDLNAAVQHNPRDVESANTLSAVHFFLANIAFKEARSEEADKQLATSVRVLREAIERNPGDPMLSLVLVEREIQTFRRDTSGVTDPTQIMDASIALRDRLIPMLDAAKQAVVDSKGATATAEVVRRMRFLESLVDPASRLARTDEIARQALLAKPNDAELLLLRAELTSERPDPAQPGAHFQAAIQQAQAVVDLPLMGVGLDGLVLFDRKTAAAYLQALMSARRCIVLTGEERTQAITQAKEYRTKLLALVPADSPQASLVDATIAFVEQDFRRANTLLTKYNRDTNNSDTSALLLLADVANQLNQPGAARDALTRVVQMDSTNISAALALGQVELQLRNFDSARAIFAQVLRVLPDNDVAKRALSTIDTIESGRGAAAVPPSDDALVDPVVRALAEAERYARSVELEPDANQKVTALLLRKAEELDFDPRIAQALAVYQVRTGDRPAAKATLDRALAKSPDNANLRAMRAGLEHEDPVQAQIAMIDAQNAPDVDKFLARAEVYLRADRAADAEREMAEANRIDPNNVRVVEVRFMNALEKRDFATATSLSDRALAEDLDGLGGLSFRARLQAAQGDLQQAATTMQQAVDRGGAGPEAYRLLGRMYMSARRESDAIRSYEQAIRLRPNDAAIVNDMLIALRVSNRADEALALARRYEQQFRGDSEFLNQWLELEASVGNRTVAIAERERILRSSPDNVRNNLELASLYIDAESWSNARVIVDRVRSTSDSLNAVTLDATLRWAQKDEAGARQVFDQYLAAIPADAKDVRPFTAYAQFLAQRNDVAGASAVLDRARPLQDPKSMDVDRALVALTIASGEYEAASAACRRVIEAGADTPEQAFRKQLVEILLRTDKLDEARTELAKLGTGSNVDADTLLLTADVAARSNDAAAQKRALDDAVARFPRDARVFMARGQFLLATRESARDAIEDFSRAIQLDPALARALQLRAIAHTVVGNTDDALNDLEAAVKANPLDDNLLFGVISDLFRQRQPARAFKVAEEAFGARTPSVALMVQLGDIYRGFTEHTAATAAYRRAWEMDAEKGDALAQRVLDSLLAEDPARVADADRFLRALGNDRISKNPGFLMTGSRIYALQNDLRTAGQFAFEAVRLLNPDNPALMVAWFNDLRRIQTDRKRLMTFLESSENSGITPDWMNYFLATLRVEVTPAKSRDEQPIFDAADMTRGEASLRRLTTEASNPAVRNLALRTLGESLYMRRDYAGAAETFRAGVAAFPTDYELQNNLAFILTKNLQKPDEALPMIEAVAKNIENNPDVLDTLGLVYMRLNRCQDALEPFRRARLLARAPVSAFTIAIHQAEAFHCLSKPAEAKAALADAREILRANEGAIDYDLRDEFDRVERLVGP
jgi:tetratricopeptide (TPR) repeat protein